MWERAIEPYNLLHVVLCASRFTLACVRDRISTYLERDFLNRKGRSIVLHFEKISSRPVFTATTIENGKPAPIVCMAYRIVRLYIEESSL
jgi:hypothetical protein